MVQDLVWDDLRVLLALSRAGTTTRAARALDVNETTVTRRLRRLEDHVGTRLIARGAQGFEAKPAAVPLLSAAEETEARLRTALAETSDRARRAVGKIRLTAVPMIMNRLLAPALGRLLGDHPGLSVDLVAEPARLDLMLHEADIALRFARPVDGPDVLAKRSATLSFAVYAAAGQDPEALPWIGYDAFSRLVPQQSWIEDSPEGAAASVAVADGETLIACLSAGLGKSWLPLAIGERLPGLVQVETPKAGHARELWLLAHPDLKGDQRLAAIRAWVEDVLQTASPRSV
jgi:DNA-binding transcriptional LysR family regulator